MANYGQPAGGYGAPGGQYPGAPGQGYGGAPAHGQQPYGATPGQQPYGAPPGQPGAPGYGGAPPKGQPGAMGYGGAPHPGQPGAPGYGAPPPGQPGYGAPGTSYGAPPAQGGWGGPPGIDPQVAQWFQSVDTDKSGKITAIELQQALVNGNWSHFNPETCRLMISMFDQNHTGTIEITEFAALWNYIQQWKGVFERFDANRSGQIEANELGQALTQMGYRLSPRFHEMIVSRFDVRARRSITLDNFIQVCVMVKSLTDMFRQRDTAMTGTIKISYEDFMMMCVLNKP